MQHSFSCRNCGADLRGVTALTCPQCQWRTDSVTQPPSARRRFVLAGGWDIVTGRPGQLTFCILNSVIIMAARLSGAAQGPRFFRRELALVWAVGTIWWWLDEHTHASEKVWFRAILVLLAAATLANFARLFGA